MTCIVGIKTEDKIYIGADRQGTSGSIARDYSEKKVFKKKNGFIYGMAGSYRLSQVIRHRFTEPSFTSPFTSSEYDKLTNDEYIFNFYIPELINCLKNNNVLEKKKRFMDLVKIVL